MMDMFQSLVFVDLQYISILPAPVHPAALQPSPRCLQILLIAFSLIQYFMLKSHTVAARVTSVSASWHLSRLCCAYFLRLYVFLTLPLCCDFSRQNIKYKTVTNWESEGYSLIVFAPPFTNRRIVCVIADDNLLRSRAHDLCSWLHTQMAPGAVNGFVRPSTGRHYFHTSSWRKASPWARQDVCQIASTILEL